MSVPADERWEAVVRRDPRADGAFVYAVQTTGVYCRPSCGARLPRRENARFFATGAEAERAGFRPCKRCRPDGPSLAERHAEAVRRACLAIAEADGPPRLEALARAAGLSPHHFHRVFKAATGLTPRAYAAAGRAERVRQGLSRGASVTEAIFEAGFGASSRFYAAAEDILGMAPSRFRQGGRGEAIRFALGQCSLGAILVAATERGVCAIQFGDDPEALVRDLQDRFPAAELRGGEPGFERWMAAVVGLVDRTGSSRAIAGSVEAPAAETDLPLDVRGTAFQQRVWQALRLVPPGTTASYGEIAARIGAPRSARAVAGACAANPLAVAIPCHRVVARDGSLGGYRWGIERKRALLRREGAE